MFESVIVTMLEISKAFHKLWKNLYRLLANWRSTTETDLLLTWEEAFKLGNLVLFGGYYLFGSKWLTPTMRVICDTTAFRIYIARNLLGVFDGTSDKE